MSEKWRALGRMQFFRLKVGDVDGQLNHFSLSIENKAFKHAGFGLGYDFFDMDVSINETRWKGFANFQFEGPMFYLTGSFF